MGLKFNFEFSMKVLVFLLIFLLIIALIVEVFFYQKQEERLSLRHIFLTLWVRFGYCKDLKNVSSKIFAASSLQKAIFKFFSVVTLKTNLLSLSPKEKLWDLESLNHHC